jgi:hypothetical protein
MQSGLRAPGEDGFAGADGVFLCRAVPMTMSSDLHRRCPGDSRLARGAPHRSGSDLDSRQEERGTWGLCPWAN